MQQFVDRLTEVFWRDSAIAYRPDEPDQRGAIWEDPDHIGSPADFSIEALL